MKQNLKPFIPRQVLSGLQKKPVPVTIIENGDSYVVSYQRPVYNQTGQVGFRVNSAHLPRQIILNELSLETIGLLQGEMSKTYRKTLTFANCEPAIINKVLRWFSKEFGVGHDDWHWYIRLNVLEPEGHWDRMYHLQEALSFWLDRSLLDYRRSYEKAVCYVKTTKHVEMQNYGTVMIERPGPIFIQTIQKLVRDVTFSILKRPLLEIRAFMRGIIAAEGCVDFHLASGHRRVFITAMVEEERNIYRQCLHKLGIQTQDCKPIKDIVISRRENILKLHELGLMTLSPEKHAKFLEMVSSYQISPVMPQTNIISI